MEVWNIFITEQNVSLLEKVRPILYTHQTSGTCAGVCAYDRTHQMEKTETVIEMFLENSCTFYARQVVLLNRVILRSS